MQLKKARHFLAERADVRDAYAETGSAGEYSTGLWSWEKRPPPVVGRKNPPPLY